MANVCNSLNCSSGDFLWVLSPPPPGQTTCGWTCITKYMKYCQTGSSLLTPIARPAMNGYYPLLFFVGIDFQLHGRPNFAFTSSYMLSFSHTFLCLQTLDNVPLYLNSTKSCIVIKGYSADSKLIPITNWKSTSKPFEVTTSGGKKILSGILVF